MKTYVVVDFYGKEHLVNLDHIVEIIPDVPNIPNVFSIELSSGYRIIMPNGKREEVVKEIKEYEKTSKK